MKNKKRETKEKTIRLKDLTIEDSAVFKKWLAAPHVAKWYLKPEDWISEIENRDGKFSWIRHFIAEAAGMPVGFCQYYACKDSDEPWEGYTALGGTYSIDYLIGETDFLRKGLGKLMIAELIGKIARLDDAKRIVVQPDPENAASRALLLSCGFALDTEKDIFVMEL